MSLIYAMPGTCPVHPGYQVPTSLSPGIWGKPLVPYPRPLLGMSLLEKLAFMNRLADPPPHFISANSFFL